MTSMLKGGAAGEENSGFCEVSPVVSLWVAIEMGCNGCEMGCGELKTTGMYVVTGAI